MDLTHIDVLFEKVSPAALINDIMKWFYLFQSKTVLFGSQILLMNLPKKQLHVSLQSPRACSGDLSTDSD